MSSSNPKHPVENSQPSLSRLLLFSHLSLASIVLLSFAGVTFWMNYNATYEKVESELLGGAEILCEQLSSGTIPQKLMIPDAFFHRFGKAERDQAYWQLWDEAGNVVASNGILPSDVRPSPKKPPQGDKRPYITRKNGTHFELFIQSPSNGQLMVGRPLAKEFDGFLRLLLWLLGVTAVGLVLSAIIAWRLVAAVTRPIESLAKMVGSIDHRELDRRLPAQQPTLEMTTLAGEFNSMLGDLQSAFDQQRKFTSDAAHELRTPVAIISGQCELSLSKPRDNVYYRNALTTCLNAASHMAGLVNQLLLLSRLDDPPKPQIQALVRLDHIVSEAVDLVTPLADKNNIQIESASVPISVNADESQLRQIALNLIANAIQFSHHGGLVSVKLEHDATNATIQVRDNGIGIAAEDIPRVCDRFFQVNQARTTTQSSGSGLGLSIVSEIVKQAGGTMSIQSELGSGTNVSILIPAAAQPLFQPISRSKKESDKDPVT